VRGRTIRRVSRVPTDYDSDPGRWRSHDDSWVHDGGPFREVAARIVETGARPVLDVGGGTGALGRSLPHGWPVVLLDSSLTQLRQAVGPKVRASARALPVPASSMGSVAMLWMLYHLDQPARAIAEAHRALRKGGLFAAATASRASDPELTDGYPPTTFDAEEAPDIVAAVFGDVDVVSWDAPLVTLPDREAVLSFCRSHFLPAEAAERVTPPVTLTKRGCFVFARK
jgi:SAM-dependent methyltransferase